ncbi:MAG TPA: hypothetical protein VF950_07215 [Planctomycetota bacterium]
MEQAQSPEPDGGNPEPGKPEPEAPRKSAAERRQAIQAGQTSKRKRGFLYGLLAGQILIIVIDLGGGALLHVFRDRVRVNAPIPLEALVFLGMSAGIVITALMILFVLGLQGLGWTFGKKKVGFFTAVGRGVRRMFQAAWALGLTLGVIGGTAWFMIPGREWKTTADYLNERKDRAVEKAKGWVDGLLPGREKK